MLRPKAFNQLFIIFLAGNRQFLAASLTTSIDNATAIGSTHALPKTVFIFSFPGRGLECPFHCISFSSKMDGKGSISFERTKLLISQIAISLLAGERVQIIYA
jgi:hypothetical protein